jgi:hypothetical protein
MIVADAACVDCEAQYLAWCGRIPHRSSTLDDELEVFSGRSFVDLSFRSTFDDEPGESDMPKWDIVVTRTRVPRGSVTP